MKRRESWVNQIKGLYVCLVMTYHPATAFYPHLTIFRHPLSEILSRCWTHLDLHLTPLHMPVFLFISGYLIRHYIDSVP